MVSNQNDELTKQIIELEKRNEREKIEKLLEEKLLNDPENIDLLFRLACLEMYMPFVDYYATTIYLEKIIAISQKHLAIISSCLAYLENGYPGGACLYPRLKQPIMWMCEVKRSWLTNKAIKQLIDDGKVDNPEETRTFFEEKLHKDPNDTETLLLLSLIELLCHDKDYGKSINYLEKISSLSKESEALAIIFLTYIKDFTTAVDQNLLNKLKDLNTDNSEINSMIKYMISIDCMDAALEEKFVEESINLYQGHVNNYLRLANIYYARGKKEEAKQLAQKAISNIKKVYHSNKDVADICDPTNIYDFFGEMIKHIYITDSSLERIYKDFGISHS